MGRPTSAGDRQARRARPARRHRGPGRADHGESRLRHLAPFLWVARRARRARRPRRAPASRRRQRNTSRDRILTDDELKLFWKAASSFEYPFGPMWRLLLLTGQRREEVAGMTRKELALDGDKPLWTIPGISDKERHPARRPAVVGRGGNHQGATEDRQGRLLLHHDRRNPCHRLSADRRTGSTPRCSHHEHD